MSRQADPDAPRRRPGYNKAKRVDDAGNFAKNGAPVAISDRNDGTGQAWTIDPDGTIQHDGECLDISTARARPTTNPALAVCL